ncbi:MAG: bifunctional phosphoribosylaminoimidazolecarboxamide formyltransferase/IMP cyclohydrolase [Terriglobales bacterium]
MPERLALLSVSDKTGLTAFARRLAACGFGLISTGGSARTLREAGLTVREISEITGFPEMLDGRVKTLHPAVHGGLLGRRDQPAHLEQMAAHQIRPIALIAVNLYPFEATAGRPGASFEELIENIDIGGPAMIRSAAKNFAAVTVLTAPEDYDAAASEIEAQGDTTLATRWRLAQKAYARTAAYDAAIAATLASREPGQPNAPDPAGPAGFPAILSLRGRKLRDLRYGENPHQSAALYADPAAQGGLAQAQPLQGKELSFNNLVDLDAAWELAQEFTAPAVAIIKHTNPAGCATAATLAEAYALALACDPMSAFGGVIGVNRVFDGAMAETLRDLPAATGGPLFVECIAAPRFAPEAREILAARKNLRLVEVAAVSPVARWQPKAISGGWLLQDRDLGAPELEQLKTVSHRAPTRAELEALRFGWIIAKHVKSNAIVFARPGQTIAVGAGQMSRVDAVKIAALKAQLPLAGSVLASDAFFPFPDSIEEAARHGITAVIQPGGSVRDGESIAVCDRLGLAMVVTGTRHFRH